MKKGIAKSSYLTIISICILFLFTSFTHPKYKDSKATTGGLLNFTIRTVTAGGNYAPKHVLAIWIEDANGFVKTRKAMANQRKQYLYTWKAASNYNVVDAITGSTLTNHQTHTVTWNCTDLSGNIVPDGDYTVWIEFTDKHAQGPLYSLTFTKSQNPQSFSPADETYFKDIQLDFTPYVAEFTADVTSICQDETVTFTDLSVGATSWSWNFGTGAYPASANSLGPHTVTYSTPGTANVSLTINELTTETKENYITVVVIPVADFSFSGNDYTVDFTNNSTNATSYLWDFGDGNTSSDNNPTHTYSSAGTFSVSLTANSLNCEDIISYDVSVPLVGTNTLQMSNELIIFYPNPTDGVINFKLNKYVTGNISISIFNAIGKLIHKSSFKEGIIRQPETLILTDLPKGIYLIKFESTHLQTNQKIILK